jgi:hypothetical protein
LLHVLAVFGILLQLALGPGWPRMLSVS